LNYEELKADLYKANPATIGNPEVSYSDTIKIGRFKFTHHDSTPKGMPKVIKCVSKEHEIYKHLFNPDGSKKSQKEVDALVAELENKIAEEKKVNQQ
jgi:hypothetical protein